MLSGCLRPQGSTVASHREFVATLSSRTIKLDVSCPNSRGWGSAVLLGIQDSQGREIAATAEHVVDRDPSCSLRYDGVDVIELGQDAKHDVALIALQNGRQLPRLGFSEPYVGMDVTILGYPVQPRDGKAGFQVSEGTLVSLAGSDYRVSASTWFGGSGGPAFDNDGKLVGIVVSVDVDQDLLTGDMTPVDARYYICPVTYVIDLLKE